MRLEFNDSEQILCEKSVYLNNALVVFNTIDNSYETIRGVDIKTLLPIKTEQFEKMLVVFNSQHCNKVCEVVNAGVCLDIPLPKYWRSGNLVDNLNTKLFTKLSVVADEGVKFKLIYDNKIISFTTYQQGLNQFMFKLSCKQIKLEISAPNESGDVSNVSLDYYEY